MREPVEEKATPPGLDSAVDEPSDLPIVSRGCS
jgi:hypothetical protein